jgi:hypothetical protein
MLCNHDMLYLNCDCDKNMRFFIESSQVEICEASTYDLGGENECTPLEKGTYAANPGVSACYA